MNTREATLWVIEHDAVSHPRWRRTSAIGCGVRKLMEQHGKLPATDDAVRHALRQLEAEGKVERAQSGAYLRWRRPAA